MKLFLSTVAVVCMIWIAQARADATADAAPDTYLVTFDGKDGTTFKWTDMNDPVMGGSSSSTAVTKDDTLVFNGTCRIVKFLKAPGFAKVSTDGLFIHEAHKFNDVSAQLDGSLQLMVRSSTPDYKGFKVAFAAKDVPRTSRYSTGSFKAGFTVKGSDWQVVSVPFPEFSYDWSPFTGNCDTKDPTGQQHHCCATANSTTGGPAYCPTKAFLSTITNMEVWAEGVEGDFHLEVKWIGASAEAKTVCKNTEYCCPDAKHCLTPTKVTCDPSNFLDTCAAGQACCPLTHLCVDVGAPCTSPCASNNSYCCPDALHCLTPTNPGTLCSGASDCKSDEVCCPITHECVAVGDKCTPP